MNHAILLAKKSNLVIDAGTCLLRTVTENNLDTSAIQRFTKWREANLYPFLKIFTPTIARTRTWVKQLIHNKNRILFEVEHCGISIGHLGLCDFNRGFEICDVVRGEKAPRHVMTDALSALIEWAKDAGLRNIQLEVASDAVPAIKLYDRLGFVPVEFVPLRTVKDGEDISWEVTDDHNATCERFLIRMIQPNYHTICRSK